MNEMFSQRIGITKPKSVIQIDSMDADLRTALWNVVATSVLKYLRYPGDDAVKYYKYVGFSFKEEIWVEFLKKTIDTVPDTDFTFINEIKKVFFQLKWHEVYDLLEFIANIVTDKALVSVFISQSNKVLKKELSGYIFVGKTIISSSTEAEIKEVEKALDVSHKFTQHLDKALDLLANRKSPDYSNSIKESISAVEALCQLITGDKKATLGQALKKLESKIGDIHPAQKKAFESLYGYTSDAEGIRHSLIGNSSLEAEDAKFMLITCSAFINYLVTKSSKAGIKLAKPK